MGQNKIEDAVFWGAEEVICLSMASNENLMHYSFDTLHDCSMYITLSTYNFTVQISKALAGADRKDLMRKLPKFIYDEEKALEVKTGSAWF